MTVCGLLTIFLPMLHTYGLLAFYAAAFGLTICELHLCSLDLFASLITS